MSVSMMVRRDTLAPGEKPRLDGWRVLLVEDEPILAMDISLELEDYGANVTVARSLRHAIETIVSSSTFDGAVLDVNLHNQEVFPAAEMLRSASVPIVFHTGHGRADVIAGDYPDAVVLLKPARPGHIASCLNSIGGNVRKVA